ncbi:hypothetical protein, conserved [Babesia bigemina]|uniref:Uncharacterized protein n=1 Tax=Babesia bigemina TaxID=5866 RepID=A0A061BSR9_BABBI|nr:hypothetical protein, conserved [Babesia bigemina]CDR71563.1 hypothetical protein, conserved [Babesia bigemina]|eukprot:XP_012770509.1 hypothetical protein, conserved [Babesia bigemina]
MTSINHSNNLCLVTLHLPSSTSCHCPDHVPPRELDKKFGENKKCEITSNNNPTNILTNLCTGLEKFLGFNSATKGYDGQGIVYSDLDRLCDAVMGFLSSIITDVNKNENLKKYNNNLNGILESIKQAKYNRKNFDSSIAFVSQGIREWVRGVEGKHQNIMTPLNKLNESMNGHMTTNMEYKKTTDQLSSWQTIAGDYLGHVLNSELAFNEIDNNLVSKISDRIALLKQVFDNFWNSVNDPAVEESVKDLNDKFVRQRREMNEQIQTKTQAVQSTLNVKFQNIEHSIKNLEDQKKSGFDDINEAVRDLSKMSDEIIAEFNLKYRSRIQQEFATLKTPMKDIDPDNDEAPLPQGTICKLREQVDVIRKQVKAMDNACRDKLTEIWKHVRDSMGDDSSKGVLAALTKLEEDIKKDLCLIRKNVGRDVKKYVKDYVIRVKEQVGIIEDKIGQTSGPLNSIYYNWDALRREIAWYATGLIGEDGQTIKPYYHGLKGIKEKVKTYTDKFKNDFGTTILPAWMDYALNTNKIVNDRLDVYFNNNKDVVELKSKFTDLKTIINQVKLAISAEISEKLSSVIGGANAIISSEDITENVKKVQAFCNNFADQLAAKTKASDGIKVMDVVKKIEKNLGMESNTPKPDGYISSNLILAVDSIFPSLVSIALQTSNTLESFTSNRKHTFVLGKSLDEAIKTANSIKDKVGKIDGNGPHQGDTITKALKQVAPEIQRLDHDLNTALGKGSDIGDLVSIKDGIDARVDII